MLFATVTYSFLFAFAVFFPSAAALRPEQSSVVFTRQCRRVCEFDGTEAACWTPTACPPGGQPPPSPVDSTVITGDMCGGTLPGGYQVATKLHLIGVDDDTDPGWILKKRADEYRRAGSAVTTWTDARATDEARADCTMGVWTGIRSINLNAVASATPTRMNLNMMNTANAANRALPTGWRGVGHAVAAAGVGVGVGVMLQ